MGGTILPTRFMVKTYWAICLSWALSGYGTKRAGARAGGCVIVLGCLGAFCLRRFFGVFAFAMASAMRLAARALPLCGAALAFVCNGFCFGVFAFALASAYAPRGAGVAPVRGGTYFSLQRQRRVSKRKPLTPPMLDRYPRALNVPILHTAAGCLMFVAIVLAKSLTLFMRLVAARDDEDPAPLCGKLCVGIRAAQDTLATRCSYKCARCPVRHSNLHSPTCGAERSIPSIVSRAREAGEAFSENVGNERKPALCRAKYGDVESPWVRVKH
ncbi:membrane hypothetical protein [Paraburkholderia piptadeniae]|uniref:Uncharacterized protein n=1 Tax=Paraburkholderia piptadeniae TaxID=1701573 RepID=A0A1N7RKS9_9BURK|nr:membrane hypothetical protein [Paraburkholderia piptadeniae]